MNHKREASSKDNPAPRVSTPPGETGGVRVITIREADLRGNPFRFLTSRASSAAASKRKGR